MGKVLPDDDEDIEEPVGTLGSDDELVGTPDAAELVLAEIDTEGSEDVGLDVEAGLDERADLGAELDSDEDDENMAWSLDDALTEVDTELDVDEQEGGWIEGSEGVGGAWDEELGLDDDDEADDDGGLEGMDDPTLDLLPTLDDEERSLEADADDDDDALEGFELPGELEDKELGDELAPAPEP